MSESVKSDIAILFLRITAGGLMLTHGWPKLMKLIAGPPYQFADPIGLGVTISLVLTVFSEALCSFLILIGLKTRWVAIPLIITMAVAAFIVHWPDPLAKKEMALLYLGMYLALFFTGGGNFSVDKMLKKA